MTFFASWVMSQNDHGYEAGRYIAHYARAAFQDAAPSLFVVTVSDSYHRPAECIQGIRSVAGNIPLIGCSSSGGIPTPAGFVQKGVSVLALRLATAPVLALERGFSHAPAVTVNRTAERVQASMSPPPKTTDNLIGIALYSGQ